MAAMLLADAAATAACPLARRLRVTSLLCALSSWSLVY